MKDTLDLAIDTYCIDGQYPGSALLGMEEKGECYIGIFKKWTEMPPKLVDIYNKLSETMDSYEYRNFFSAESRIGKGGVFLNDPCCRFGSPPGELQINMFKNLPDILWYGAEGKCIDPVCESKYGVELIIHSDWANKNWLPVEFPKGLRDKIKFRNYTEFKEKGWIIPQEAGPRIAAIVEEGNNLDDIIEMAKEDGEKIRGYQVENFTRSFPIAQEKIKTLKSFGINFGGEK